MEGLRKWPVGGFRVSAKGLMRFFLQESAKGAITHFAFHSFNPFHPRSHFFRQTLLIPPTKKRAA